MVGVITEWGGTMNKQDKQLASFQLSCSIVILYYNHYVQDLSCFDFFTIRDCRNKYEGKNFQRYTTVLKASETSQSCK